jgi:hypothetical protein
MNCCSFVSFRLIWFVAREMLFWTQYILKQTTARGPENNFILCI